ncbi:DUF2528 family protein [Pseudomonas laurylsulfatiphila]|uniref:DUF2528 family protein n=1 Tax=Pseudomonas laurylsulfatiphila TaxID=2011015 RepID=UPI00215F987E|nr:DUF2528 family protein [Pseudomonas laurylsulfatiphila]UVM06394.1 DUF2528 family protein [Pseudomonas laurylsulfatiphila]
MQAQTLNDGVAEATTPTNLKRYRVAESWKDYEVLLEVNLDVLTSERAAMINQYFGDDKTRLMDECDDVVRVAIRLAGSTMIRIMLEQGGAGFTPTFKNVFGDNPGASWTRDLHSTEGFGGCEVDELPYGWCGMRVIGAEVDVPGFFEVELTELPVAQEA